MTLHTLLYAVAIAVDCVVAHYAFHAGKTLAGTLATVGIACFALLIAGRWKS